MGKFRKKPIVIEAVKFDGGHETARSILQWMINSWPMSAPQPKYSEKDGGVISIPTLEGTMTASLGDWIIKGVKGEFYPCKPDIFVATYDAVIPNDT